MYRIWPIKFKTKINPLRTYTEEPTGYAIAGLARSPFVLTEHMSSSLFITNLHLFEINIVGNVIKIIFSRN